MKKTAYASLALLLPIFLAFPADAQESILDQGRSSLSVGFGFSPLSLFAPITTSAGIHRFEVSPAYEYFALPRLSVGGRFQHRFTAGKLTNVGYTSIGPRVAYYLPFSFSQATKDRLFLYMAASAGHTWRQAVSPKNASQESVYRSRYLTGSLSTGVRYMFRKRTGLFFETAYQTGHLLKGTERFNFINGTRSLFGLTFTF